MISWKNERRKISELKPAAYNPRKFSEKQLADLSKSINRFSLADPVIVNFDNTVIGGHLRLRALKAQGAGEVDVRVPETQLSEAEEKELNVRLNKNAGEFDLELLAANFDETFLTEVGFDSAEIDKILRQDVAEDEVPDIPAVAESKTGEVYTLGQKHIFCPKCGDKIYLN